MFLCDEAVPETKVLLLSTGSNANAKKADI